MISAFKEWHISLHCLVSMHIIFIDLLRSTNECILVTYDFKVKCQMFDSVLYPESHKRSGIGLKIRLYILLCTSKHSRTKSDIPSEQETRYAFKHQMKLRHKPKNFFLWWCVMIHFDGLNDPF